jgi:hypothetical protein
MDKLKNFAGCIVYSHSFPNLNGKLIERTVRKAFLNDNDSTLYVVKVKGIRAYQELYEDEMVK